jgi:predicted TIM-barrel enzyme
MEIISGETSGAHSSAVAYLKGIAEEYHEMPPPGSWRISTLTAMGVNKNTATARMSSGIADGTIMSKKFKNVNHYWLAVDDDCDD